MRGACNKFGSAEEWGTDPKGTLHRCRRYVQVFENEARRGVGVSAVAGSLAEEVESLF